MKKSIDNKNTIEEHASLIKSKKVLNIIYLNFYNKLLKTKIPKGKVVELGSGGGFLKDINSKIITSDVVKGNNIDKVFLAEKMPFKKSSISAFYLLNTLHHIKDSEKALKEMERCLKKNGKIIMIEPFNSLWSKFIYTNFHHELFDPNVKTWKIKGRGRLTSANGAIPWIIFERDKEIFIKKFPSLKINRIQPHTPFSYLLSGGLSKPQLLPTFIYPLVLLLEKLISPLNKFFGMFATFEIEKI